MKSRIREIRKQSNNSGNIVYWMSRDQRISDNWALRIAQQFSIERKQKLCVVFTLTKSFLNASPNKFHFLINGLKEVEATLQQYRIPFILLFGDNPAELLSKLIKKENISTVVCDFDPLKIKKQWRSDLLKNSDTGLLEVDAHNIVPVWEASFKKEFGAYTFRPKITKKLNEYLDQFPKIENQPEDLALSFSKNDWEKIDSHFGINNSNLRVLNFVSGESAAHSVLQKFISENLKTYSIRRNNPLLNSQSQLSPYLHFGQISSQRVAHTVKLFENEYKESVDAFLEELIVRKELSDNFCFYNENYDNFSGFPEWSQKSLNEHRDDRRDFIYTLEDLENANTHDDLWNASQIELKTFEKMHGYMRMYWAKKILEWTETPEKAIEYAIYLNDKYSLDGRDPNGYTGIAWSIGGVHDRAWFERPVYGKVRYMNYNGCLKKFDVKSYIAKLLKYR